MIGIIIGVAALVVFITLVVSYVWYGFTHMEEMAKDFDYTKHTGLY